MSLFFLFAKTTVFALVLCFDSSCSIPKFIPLINIGYAKRVLARLPLVHALTSPMQEAARYS